MSTLEESRERFKPIQEIEPPDLDHMIRTEVARVDLGILPEDSLVAFSGLHTASNYVINVLDSHDLGNRRKVNLWYVGSGELTALGTHACFIGPGRGCLQTEARRICSVDLRKGLNHVEEGVLEVGKQYCLPTFRWYDGELSADIINSRIETYTRIELITD